MPEPLSLLFTLASRVSFGPKDDPYAPEKPLQISGSEDAVAKAKKMVEELLGDGDPVVDAGPRLIGYDGKQAPSSGDIANNLEAYQSRVEQMKVGSCNVRAIGDWLNFCQQSRSHNLTQPVSPVTRIH